MAIANIVALLSGASHDDVVLATAFAAAKPFHAHVDALFLSSDVRAMIAATEPAFPPHVAQQVAHARSQSIMQRSKNARASFAAAVARSEVKIARMAQPSETVTTAYREESGQLLRVLDANTKFADLVVFPPNCGARNSDLHDAFIPMLLQSARPLLLSPDVPPEHIGTAPAVGWDGGQAAANALIAALPFLESARHARLLCVEHGLQRKTDLVAVKEYLDLHGVSSTGQLIERTSRPIGEALLDAAQKAGCDLVIVGGYGHSRALESIFGGASEHISSHARIPILMVH